MVYDTKPDCTHIGKKNNLHQRGVQNGTRHVRGRPLTRLGVQKTGQAQASSHFALGARGTEGHTTNYEASRGIVTDRPYAAAPPPATDWDAPAPYKGNLAMLLQAMIATEDGPAAALAAAMMAETNTPMEALAA